MDELDWLTALSPWPEDGFGLDRMVALLASLGDPQLAYPAVHVVGTKGKSTATVTIEQLLLGDGFATVTSTAGWVAPLPFPGPNTSAAPPSSCAFHDVI